MDIQEKETITMSTEKDESKWMAIVFGYLIFLIKVAFGGRGNTRNCAKNTKYPTLARSFI